MSFEILNLLGSSLLGGIMQIMGSRANAQQEQQKMLMQRAEFVEKSKDKIRQMGNPNFFSGSVAKLPEIIEIFSKNL